MSTSSIPMTIQKTTNSGLGQVDFSNLKFGEQFSDHMVLIDYHQHTWQTPEIRPYGPISVMPSMSIFHYGQGVFEGMKAFKTHDGHVTIFRPDKHYQRFKRSCERMCIPVLPEEVFMASLTKLVELDQDWVPEDKFKSLYIRPFVVAAEEFLGLRACTRYKFMIITCPVGNYYGAEVKPVSLTTMPEYVRAVAGGLGEAKVPGNYAGALLPTQTAQEKGYAQVLWLDAFEHRYIEEVGSMNMCFYINGTLVTPPLAGTILPGVTRDSILTLARDWGMPVEERRITIDELIQHATQGTLQEAFGMGTAAVITPVGKIHHQGTDIVINNNEFGPVAQRFYDHITRLHHGETTDTHGWNCVIA